MFYNWSWKKKSKYKSRYFRDYEELPKLRGIVDDGTTKLNYNLGFSVCAAFFGYKKNIPYHIERSTIFALLLRYYINTKNKFTILDGKEIDPNEDDLMICDEDSPMCLAGVYGGLNHSVSSETKTIFLESAYFNPVSIRKSSKRHSLNTDSSYRFERGVDLENTEFALKRAAALIIEHCEGNIVSDIMDEFPGKIDEKNIVLNFDNVDSLIGFKIDRLKIKSILNLLDFKINNVTDISAGITIPIYRHDVSWNN